MAEHDTLRDLLQIFAAGVSVFLVASSFALMTHFASSAAASDGAAAGGMLVPAAMTNAQSDDSTGSLLMRRSRTRILCLVCRTKDDV